MNNIDAMLDEAEKQKAKADPVPLAQQQLAPVRAWALQSKKDFEAGAAKLQERICKAMDQVNRLEALRGEPLGSLRALFIEVDRLKTGIPNGYQKIVEDIDGLTPWHVAQPNYMIPLRHAQAPGNISHLVEALVRLERSLDEHAARLG